MKNQYFHNLISHIFFNSFTFSIDLHSNFGQFHYLSMQNFQFSHLLKLQPNYLGTTDGCCIQIQLSKLPLAFEHKTKFTCKRNQNHSTTEEDTLSSNSTAIFFQQFHTQSFSSRTSSNSVR